MELYFVFYKDYTPTQNIFLGYPLRSVNRSNKDMPVGVFSKVQAKLYESNTQFAYRTKENLPSWALNALKE